MPIHVHQPLTRSAASWLRLTLLTILAAAGLQGLMAQVATTYTSSGSFLVPAGVTKVTVECWGGGGHGSTRTTNGQGGGGGGGAYARSTLTVIPGNTYTVTVGTGSSTTAPGGDSWFSSAATILAKGGGSVADNTSTGATGGTAAASIGTVKFSGGNGGNGGSFIVTWGGGGGSSAGYAAVGANGNNATGGTAPAGGGNGANGSSGFGGQAPGVAGSPPGGGGSGARRTSSNQAGGNGAGGKVVVSYYSNGTCISGITGFNYIPDNGCGAATPMSVPVLISGQPTTLGTSPGNARLFSVELIVAHTFNADMEISLVAPGGSTRSLVADRFGTGDNLGNPGTCPAAVFTLFDGGTALSNSNTSNVTGTFNPEQSLAGFSGDPNGTWTLNICDDLGGDVGNLVYLKLNFCTVPQIISTTSNSPVCSPSPITLGVTATGSPAVSYAWSGTGTFAPNNTSANVSVTGAATGNYNILVSNSCGSTNTNVAVVVNTPPVITCPGNSSVCIDVPAFALTGGSPAGGAYSGTGVSGGNFDPSAAGAGTHTITYNYTDGNGCTNTPCTFQITVNALPVVTCGGPYGPVCEDAADIALSGSPIGGTWSGTGVTGSTFDPSAGTQLVTYSYTDGNGCSNSCSTTITVNPLPVMTCPPSSGTCIDAAAFSLNNTGENPTGGTFSGTGVSGNSFDPAVAGLGSHTIIYSYTDGNGCSNTCTFSITVNDLPIVTCPGDITGICSSDAAFTLTGGSPAGGTYSGTGVSGGNFDPSVAGGGTHTITYSFTDGTGCSDECSFSITVTQATTWYADTDGDGYGDAADDSLSCGTPAGYVLNDDDDCPTVFGLNGDSCNDGNPFTTGDILVGCVCTGTPVPCDTWTLTTYTDGAGSEISWQVVDATSPFVLASGGPYPNNTSISQNICVPQGACFDLIYSDAGSNGISPGGWVLTDQNGKRVIDNYGNGGAFSSTCQPSKEFCSPVGSDAITVSGCDKVNWLPNEYIVAAPNAAVSGQWLIGNQADDGYQFWFLNPVGGYSRRILHTHAASMGFGPASATRACHMPLSFTPSPIPFNTLLNVRVRSLVNGVYSDFGPACRFMLLPAPLACPTTQLENNPLNIGTTYSCGVTGKQVNASGYAGKLWANIVPGATNYRWRFQVPSEGYTRVISTTTYFVPLGLWATNPLLCGTFEYDVEVAVSMDGGNTYCPYGVVCTAEITNNAPNPCSSFQPGGGSLHMAPMVEAEFTLWPNPNRGDLLNLQLSELEEGVSTVYVEVYDLFGKRVMDRAIPTEGAFTTMIQLSDVATGLYTVNVLAGSKTYTERLVIQ